jgi:hypothetical protein
VQDTLHRSEVRLLGIMHMKTNLLDDIGNVWVGERKVLEGPSEAPELSWISNRRIRSGRDLGLHVHWCRD